MKTIILIVFTWILCSCTGNDPISGSGSQTTNGVTIAVSSDSIRVTGKENSTSMLYSSSYVPFNDSGYADTVQCIDGSCLFLKVPGGMYNILVVDYNDSLAAIIQDVNIGGSSTVHINDSLLPYGSISGTIRQENDLLSNYAVFIRGTPFQVYSDTNGAYLFTALPMGSYRLSVMPTTESIGWGEFVTSESVTVSPDYPENTVDIVIDP